MEKKAIEKFGVQADKARVIFCFRNGDKVHKGERMVLNMKKFRTYDQVIFNYRNSLILQLSIFIQF